MKDLGTGDPVSAEDVIDTLGGALFMDTDPSKGTLTSRVEQAKIDYIRLAGYEDKITVESQVGIPILNADGSIDRYEGTLVTKKWLKEQYDKGHDVEFSVSYYVWSLATRKWIRTSGHTDVYIGGVPGESAGGHMFSLSSIYDPFNSDEDTDFQISFTDPGRDDLTGEYGAIAHDQYWLTDYAGVPWFNTASTYQVIYDPDPFGLGVGALLLDGYQGEGDFHDDPLRIKLTVLEGDGPNHPRPRSPSPGR